MRTLSVYNIMAHPYNKRATRTNTFKLAISVAMETDERANLLDYSYYDKLILFGAMIMAET